MLVIYQLAELVCTLVKLVFQCTILVSSFFMYKYKTMYTVSFNRDTREILFHNFLSVFHLQYLIWYQSIPNLKPWKTLIPLLLLLFSMNSLILQHGNSPSSILVSQPLTDENYNSWSRSMLMALSTKSKICLIDGSMSKPYDSSSNFKAWTRCNDMVLSWIINSVSKEIATNIIYIDNAEAMWRDLKERFSQGNGPHIFQLQKSIAAIT
jgi:hypothetical protein